MKTIIKPEWSDAFGRFSFGWGDGDVAAREIGSWLEDCGGEERVPSLLAKIETLSPQSPEENIEAGNAHYVASLSRWFLIECAYVYGDKVLLTHEQIIRALESYTAYTKTDTKNQQIIPPSFEVEYEAVGEDAIEKWKELGGTKWFTQEDIEGLK